MVMNAPFAQRYEKLCDIVMHNPNIEVVPTHVINSLEELAYYHTKFLSEGYEGTMVRHSDENYAVNKRSSQLLKYKDFLDETYIVVDVVPSESRPEQGVVVCSSPKGNFNCGMKFSHFERKVILEMKHEFIGQMAEVRFFEYTDGGLPRFPVCVGFRED